MHSNALPYFAGMLPVNGVVWSKCMVVVWFSLSAVLAWAAIGWRVVIAAALPNRLTVVSLELTHLSTTSGEDLKMT